MGHWNEMQEAIIVSFRWSEQEMLNVQKLHMRYTKEFRKLRRTYIAAIVFFSVFAIGSVLRSPRFTFALPFFAILIPLFCLPLFIRRATVKAYAKRPDKDMVVTYEITSERLTQRNEISTSEMLWKTFIRAQRLPEGFLLYVSDRSIHWLPVHGFQNLADVEPFAQIIQKNVPNYESSV